jgi:hypothetical protein
MTEQFQNVLVQYQLREGDLLREVAQLNSLITMERAETTDLTDFITAETTAKLTKKHKAVVRSPTNGSYTACRWQS